MNSITLYEALERMRELTTMGIPFTFEFVTCNLSNNSSKGFRVVDKALLRTGLSRDTSSKSEILIGYTEEPNAEPRWFYLPLLKKFNGIQVKP